MAIISISVGLVIPVAAHAAGTTWQEEPLAVAIERAQRDGKWVLVDVYASWCVPCQKMDSEVYPRDEVGRAVSAGFVALRRDGESGEGLAIAQRYHVVGFPTLLVLDGKGVEIDRMMGGLSASELVLKLTRMREGNGTLAQLEQEVERAPSDALKLEVAMRHAMRGDARAVVELTEVVRIDPMNQSHRAASALLTLGKYFYLRGTKDYPHAESTLLELEKRFPTTDEASQATYARAVAIQHMGRSKDAQALLDDWMAKAPKDEERVAASAWFCFKEGGDKARGIEIAKRGLVEWPNEDGLWDTLGELYLLSGKPVLARQAFAKAAELVPKSDYYRAQLKKVGGTQ